MMTVSDSYATYPTLSSLPDGARDKPSMRGRNPPAQAMAASASHVWIAKMEA